MQGLLRKTGWRTSAALLGALLLAGCAGSRLQREGQALIEAGQYEQGLEKLSAASKADPGNLAYRASWMRLRDGAINRLQAQANSARAARQPEVARGAYENILRIDRGNHNALAGLAQLDMDGRHARLADSAGKALKDRDVDGAQALVKRILVENPASDAALRLQRQIDEQADAAVYGVPTLQGKFKKPVTLQFRDANIKFVLEALSRASGINLLLDKDVKPDLKISIFVKDVSVEDCIDLILLQSQLEKKVISDSTLLIYQSTPAKLREYQDLKIRSFHLVNADAKQMVAMIKTILKTKDIVAHERTNSIVMRDIPEAVELAAKLVADQDVADPEVMLEVEVLEIGGSRLSELGLAFPSSLTAAVPGGDSLTLDALRKVRAGSLLVGPVPSISLSLLLQDGESNLLASPRIRARNREKAKIMIGDRVPVITNAVTPVSTGAPVVTGNVQYLDVGLKLEVEPEIHADNEVSIKINLEVSSIVKEVQNAVSGTLAYQVGTRNAATVLRLKDGETQILGGLISDEDRNSASKVPGLGQLPLLGRLFSTHKGDKRKTEIVLSITPRIIGASRAADARKMEYWSGTETSLRGNPLMMRQLGTVALDAASAPTGMLNRGSASPRAPATAVSAPAAASPATQPVMLSWQGPSQAKVGERISVAINAQSSQPFQRIALAVGFDPNVLEAVEVAEGDLLKQNNMASTFTHAIDQASGQVAVELTASGNGAASGAGSIATVVFEVLAASEGTPVTASNMQSAAASGAPLLVNPVAVLTLPVAP
jgi:general secretion pathway protein D